MESTSKAISKNATRISDASTPNDLFLFRQNAVVHSRKLGHQSAKGFTLVEVLVVITLLTLLMGAAASSIASGKLIARRLSDYTAALSLVQAKVDDIRAANYNPPTSPFGASAVVLTNATSIDLNQAGTAFVISGTVTSTITPVTAGHLVTVTGTFQTRRKPITVSLQTVVNKYSAGQQ